MTAIRGFTLVEMAMVLLIISMLVGGMLLPLSTQIENNRRSQTKDSLSDTKDALIGFSIINSRLPCPDTDGDGLEDSPCTSPSYGDLPWQTLGTNRYDSWGQVFHYAVSVNFTNLFTLATAGSLQVCEQSTCTNILANALPAVFFSTGKTITPSMADEQENIDANDNIYVTRTYSEVSGNEFDDLVDWLPTNILMLKMVNAGKLP